MAAPKAPVLDKAGKEAKSLSLEEAVFGAALSAHANDGSLGIVDSSAFGEPSTKQAAALVEEWGRPSPLLVVLMEGEDSLARSFRNLDRVALTVPSELDVS